jgi:hypothetical protein
MSVSIGLRVGQQSFVSISEERDGKSQLTLIDPEEFLKRTGLELFFQLHPDYARIAQARRQESRKPRRKVKHVDKEKTSK